MHAGVIRPHWCDIWYVTIEFCSVKAAVVDSFSCFFPHQERAVMEKFGGVSGKEKMLL